MDLYRKPKTVFTAYLSAPSAAGSVFIDGAAESAANGVFEFRAGRYVGLYYNFQGTRMSVIIRTGGGKTTLPQCDGSAEILVVATGIHTGRVEKFMVEAYKQSIDLDRITVNGWKKLELIILASKKWNVKTVIEEILEAH